MASFLRKLKALRRPGRVARALLSRFPLPGLRRYCVVCERHCAAFLPYRRGLRDCAPLMLELEVVGGDPVHCACPWCGCTDRERHLLLFFKRSGLWDKISGFSVLHLAPEARFSELLTQQAPALYVKTDLMPALAVDLQADSARLPFPDESFDLLLANHVLEHVGDLAGSLDELARVLKPGGHAVLQTPFSPVLTRTIEDEAIQSEGARFHAYGQEDHVRLFGRDVFSTIAGERFRSAVTSHESLLVGDDPRYLGLNEREPFFLFEKP